MANTAHIRLPHAAEHAAATGHGRHRKDVPSFQQVLAGKWHAAAPHADVTRAAARIPVTPRATLRPTPVPAATEAALDQAMARENVPASWKSGLSFIMAQESGGQVGARNPVHSARGLYQLTRANWHLNPHGAASFGNAVEEAQGGIRYIRTRYGSADRAVAFWMQHRWY